MVFVKYFEFGMRRLILVYEVKILLKVLLIIIFMWYKIIREIIFFCFYMLMIFYLLVIILCGLYGLKINLDLSLKCLYYEKSLK